VGVPASRLEKLTSTAEGQTARAALRNTDELNHASSYTIMSSCSICVWLVQHGGSAMR
jgi:hypothetical protein